MIAVAWPPWTPRRSAEEERQRDEQYTDALAELRALVSRLETVVDRAEKVADS